jgi:ribose transport system substrate-binding protein
MKKKVLASVLSVAMVATMMVGCGSSSSTTAASSAAPAAAASSAAASTAAAATTASTAAATTAASTAAAATTASTATPNGKGLKFEIVSKGFQHQYWQAVLKGANDEAEATGVGKANINFVGPDSESDISQQVQMMNNAINAKPNAIGLAALDTNALLDSIKQAQAAKLPIIGFDSGVPNAPAGAVLANCSTDNYKAGALAADNTYTAIKDQITGATKAVRIGVLSQDATSESVCNRGLGFIDEIGTLAAKDGKTVAVTGNDKFVSDSKCTKVDKSKANIIIEVLVPAQVDSALSATDCQTLENKADTIAIFGSNQHSGEAMVTADENLSKFGTGSGKIVGVAFDSGTVIKGAVKSGEFLGAVTQAPVSIGKNLIDQLINSAKTGKASNVDTGCQWYNSKNIADPTISQNLYD